MKKNLLIVSTIITAGLIAAAIPAGIALSKASNSGASKNLSNLITATKPGRGETVSFLPESVSKFWAMDNLFENYPNRALDIGELTPYCDEQASWSNYLGNTEENKEMRRYLYDKYDIYRPCNNSLAWNSDVDAKSYRVVISQDKEFKNIEREYTVNGDENSVIFENPYSGTDYYWQVIATKQDESLVYSDIFNFTTANLPRTIKLDGISNTRDLGGNVGLNGKKMKEGLIYRGNGLEAITNDATKEFKNELGIITEIDLRGDKEGIENYLNLPNYFHCPSPYAYTSGQATHGIEYTGTGSLVKSFGNAIKALSNKNNYPVYFHCTVGRDRTGWLGICLNLLCGVSEEITLKEFVLSLFSCCGAYTKGSLDFYTRYMDIRNYLDTFQGNNMSEKIEDYLVSKAGVTHEECANVRGILLGDIDTGFVPGKVNPDPYTNLVKVTFRQYGKAPIIKMVEKGSLLEEPSISGSGKWYYGDKEWNFATDTVTEDTYLDFISFNKCKVAIHYTGIDIPDDAIDVAYHTDLDFTRFNRSGYTFKVYDDTFQRITSLLVDDDVMINVVYSPIAGYIPKSNSRIIVIGGQSNAAGVGHYNYLETSLTEDKVAEINNGYDNVLITGVTQGVPYKGWEKVHATSKTATVVTPGSFGFELSMAERFSKVYPDETTYIVKVAYGAVSLNYEWISPSCEVEQLAGAVITGRERGCLYNDLVSYLTDAIADISETTNTIPMVEGFMWMQGESDSTTDALVNVYLTTFNDMINDFTTTFADNISYKFAVYDAAINESSLWLYAKEMNMIKRSRADDRNVYVDTMGRGLTTAYEPVGNVDNAHYDAACYIDLGHMFADAYFKHNDKNYTHNDITIEAPESITLHKDQALKVNPKAYFNGVKCNAKFSFFSRDISLFKIDENNQLIGLFRGKSLLRITAYYNDEVNTITIPVEIID